MRRVKKIVRRQAILAVSTLALIAVLIFAMTSAWYTNVSKVSSLTFSAETWGFDPADITVGTGSIPAAPGKSGFIPITVDNTASADIVNVKVNVNWSQGTSDEIKKRIFFYADTPLTTGTETSPRTYIGSNTDYTYTVLPGSELILGEDYRNDVPLKWEWVYDMEGYYFYGEVANGSASVYEYLRPIEYDLESATFETSDGVPHGKLLTVGEDTTAEFLTAISATDGIPGTINAASAVTVGEKVYYPVALVSEGVGVWAYLCTYEEIDLGISYDTLNLANNQSIVASLMISASNVPSAVTAVSDETALRAALQDSTTDVVELSGNVSIATAVTVSGGDKIIDLNGNRLEYTGSGSSYSLFRAREGSSLTVFGGSIAGNGEYSGTGGTVNSVAFDVIGADVTLSGVTITGFDNAVYVYDNGGTGLDSTVRLYNCNIDTENLSVYVMGNGSASAAPTTLIVEGCTINSNNYAGISGQGSTDLWGTDITVLNSTVSGYYTAIYLPAQNTTALIKGSTLEGITGIAIKGGSVRIIDSDVRGTGYHVAAAASGGGWTDTGDGIYVEAVYAWDTSVTVSGDCHITSVNAYAFELFGRAGSGKGSAVIRGGEFEGGAGAVNWNDIGSFAIYDGTFSGGITGNVTRYDQ